MSYDVMVFDPERAPRARPEFMAWYAVVMGDNEDRDADPSPKLSAWYEEMRGTFPAMNGPFASEDFDDPRVTEYEVGASFIYACFAWSQLENARETAVRLAAKHGLGFFDASSDDGGVWLPTGDDSLALAHRETKLS